VSVCVCVWAYTFFCKDKRATYKDVSALSVTNTHTLFLSIRCTCDYMSPCIILYASVHVCVSVCVYACVCV
jgi:hypothetical protein